MKSILTVFFICISYLGLYGQGKDDTIHWRPDYKLKWEDFQGEIPLRPTFTALSFLKITYTYSYSNNKIIFHVKNVFYKKKSVALMSFVDSVLLTHEQTHFNISELWARIFLEKLKKAKFHFGVNVAEVNKIYADIIREEDLMSQQYDIETRRSLDHQKQADWDHKISEMISQLPTLDN